MNKDNLVFLKHILGSINKIEKFSNGLTQNKFLHDDLRQSAIVRQIEIIGEASKNLPIEFTVTYPHVEWSKIAGMRNKLVHHYFGIDWEIVWQVIKIDLPKLKKDIKEILEKETKKG